MHENLVRFAIACHFAKLSAEATAHLSILSGYGGWKYLKRLIPEGEDKPSGLKRTLLSVLDAIGWTNEGMEPVTPDYYEMVWDEMMRVAAIDSDVLRAFQEPYLAQFPADDWHHFLWDMVPQLPELIGGDPIYWLWSYVSGGGGCPHFEERESQPQKNTEE